MTEIDRAQCKAMDLLSEWINSYQPEFNEIEMRELKRWLTSAFREYETEIEEWKNYSEKLRVELSASIEEAQGTIAANQDQGGTFNEGATAAHQHWIEEINYHLAIPRPGEVK